VRRIRLLKARFRATLATLWLLTNTALTVSYVVTGRLTPESARTIAALLPLVAAGMIAGGSPMTGSTSANSGSPSSPSSRSSGRASSRPDPAWGGPAMGPFVEGEPDAFRWVRESALLQARMPGSEKPLI